MFEMSKRAFGKNRVAVFTPIKWESMMGYARGVRVDNLIFISGTVAADSTGAVVGRTITEQTEYILQKIRAALQELGGDLKNVVRIDTFLVDFSHFDAYAKVHHKYFAEVPPVNTTVQCARLVNTDFLIEIAAMAVVSKEGDDQST